MFFIFNTTTPNALHSLFLRCPGNAYSTGSLACPLRSYQTSYSLPMIDASLMVDSPIVTLLRV